METKYLGNSDMAITPVGVGAWAMGGGGWAFGWGPQDDDHSAEAILEAVNHGVNWIDTAAIYGFGHSEEIVGRAVKALPNKPYIFTKCERKWDDNRQVVKSLKRDSIRRECEASLRRLDVNVIDLYQVHWPEPDEDIEEGWTALAELQAEGTVRYIGVSNFNVDQMRRAQAIAPITSLQPPYSMLVRGIESEILPFCLVNDIGVIVYSPMRNGLLSGLMTRDRALNLPIDDHRRRLPDFQEPKLSQNLQLVEHLNRIAKRHGRNAGEVAIAWTLHHEAVTAAIVGLRSAEQLHGVIGATDLKLSEDDLREIQSVLPA